MAGVCLNGSLRVHLKTPFLTTSSTLLSNLQSGMDLPLYAPYKTVGYVTDGIPFVVNQLGDELFLLVSIGKAIQIFKLDRLTSCLISQQLPSDITSLVACGHETFASSGNEIYVLWRTKVVRVYNVHNCEILGMAIVGRILLSYDCENNIMILDTKSREVIGELKLLHDRSISCLMHPATYLNKFLVGFSDGNLELWNVRRRCLVHSFSGHRAHFAKEDGQTTLPGVLCMEQSPACDVVAVGFSSGDILLINLKLDEVLFSFRQSGEGGSADCAVVSLSFRTDVAAEQFPYLVSAGSDGRLFVWHLGCPHRPDEPRRLMSVMEEAHASRVSKVQFLHGEPVMVSAAEDNSVKMWIFDSPDGSARLLRSREGHRGGANRVRFYGGTTAVSMRENADAMSCEMLSAGSDGSLRLFNFALESQNREISQKPILKKLGLQRRNEKLPPIEGFDWCETRQNDWADVATIHRNHSNTYLWRFRNRVITETILRQPCWKTNAMLCTGGELERANHASAVCLTSCGNFCIVGSKGGAVYLYNAQSGLTRGSFPKEAVEPTIKKGLENIRRKQPGNVLHDRDKLLGVTQGTANSYQAGSLSSIGKNSVSLIPASAPTQVTGHTDEVTGLFVNITNSCLVSVGRDGMIIFWNFATHAVISSTQLSSPQVRLEGFKEGDFICTVGQDRMLRLFDVSARKLCRRFDGAKGHSRAITDVAFTPDCRRLLSCSLDCTVRVWDIPTSRCLSWLKFDSPLTSLCMSLSGEYMCVTLADREGIHMYIDRSLYETVHFWKEPKEPSLVGDCHVVTDNVGGENSLDENGEGVSEEPVVISAVQPQVREGVDGPSAINALAESTAQRGDGITMAALPKAYWITLFNLEAIKERNRPSEPPTAPPQAPFFLPTVVRSDAGSLAPSFPTPQEYQKLVAESSGGAETVKENAKDEEEQALADLAHLGSVWEDGDEDGEWGEGTSGDHDTALNDKKRKAAGGAQAESTHSAGPVGTRHQSKILRRQKELPRCKLSFHIDEQFPFGPEDSCSNEEDTSVVVSPISEYLKSLPPPAVDVQMRSLCNGPDDEKGVELLYCMLVWMAQELLSGRDFEVLQAYLHRFMVIYGDMMIGITRLQGPLQVLAAAQDSCSRRFRHLVQSNLCVLKVMAQIPSI